MNFNEFGAIQLKKSKINFIEKHTHKQLSVLLLAEMVGNLNDDYRQNDLQ